MQAGKSLRRLTYESRTVLMAGNETRSAYSVLFRIQMQLNRVVCFINEHTTFCADVILEAVLGRWSHDRCAGSSIRRRGAGGSIALVE
jgi:hypothetical protein